VKDRWLGIDYGDSRIGLAISDELGAFAHPYRTLRNDPDVADQLATIVAREKVRGIVIGLPRNMDGSYGPSAAKAKAFGAKLEAIIVHCPVRFWDERLTTREAQRALHAAGKNTRQSKSIIDQVAAQILLQNFLDSLQQQ
jgi:putative pre-16S rRNA nuclease